MLPLESVTSVVAIPPDDFLCNEIHVHQVVRRRFESHQVARPTHPLVGVVLLGELQGCNVDAGELHSVGMEIEI